MELCNCKQYMVKSFEMQDEILYVKEQPRNATRFSFVTCILI
jgi:hypothetical protein